MFVHGRKEYTTYSKMKDWAHLV